MRISTILRATAFVGSFGLIAAHALEPVPEKLAVLTFDDSVASQFTVVRPILKRLGFGATFFISEGFTFRSNKQDYMTWDQITQLHRDGFEIGNHTRDHLGVSVENVNQLRDQVEAINQRCAEHGIPRPTSFGYPGNSIVPGALPILKELGFRFARRGGAPEYPYDWGRGFAFEPGLDHPLLIPSAGDARPDWTIDDFKRAADQAKNGRIAVFQFHGVPDREHPWVKTRPERFEEFMRYLQANQFNVIALRDLERYVDPEQTPSDPLAIIEKRKSQRAEVLVEGEIVDADTGKALPARIYIRGAGGWHFPKSASSGGSAIRYERRNGGNTNAVEMHTTLSAHPFRVELTPGTYTITVEHGKEYFPVIRELVVERGLSKVSFRLRRWVNMAEAGWYSGDTHNHRDPEELPNALLAEDVNVALPMVDWTTTSTVPPTRSGHGFFASGFGNAPVRVDAMHLWYPRNTEYEIFRTGERNHTLGALLILNHKTRFDQPALPLAAVAAQARAEGALLDLEKHNWPWSVALVPLLKVDLFELANNHHWETEYAIRKWAVPAPSWMGLAGSGTETERDWTLYGFQTYYALLNCGFNLRPAAGTANGVHPVPLGFSRVYVHLDGPFTFESWMGGLSAGRSFVTTGPMLFAKADGKLAGTRFAVKDSSGPFHLECAVQSESPLETVELIVNGELKQRFELQNQQTASGAFETKVSTEFRPTESSWLAWRCFEKRPNARIRFAHSAPWHFEVPGKPLRPRKVEADWLVARVKEEIERSRGTAPDELIQDYQAAERIYEEIARTSR